MDKEKLTQTNKESAEEKKSGAIEYEGREALDGKLLSAISDILSAEEEAKHIIAEAEARVKAIQLDGATRERDMRKQNGREAAVYHDKAITDASKRAETDRAKRIAAAEAEGEKLVSSKSKEIEKAADELYRSLGGKA